MTDATPNSNLNVSDNENDFVQSFKPIYRLVLWFTWST